MNKTTQKPTEALELLPEEMREPAVAYLIEQAERYKVLKAEIDKGLEDIAAGRMRERDFGDFLRRADRRAGRP